MATLTKSTTAAVWSSPFTGETVEVTTTGTVVTSTQTLSDAVPTVRYGHEARTFWRRFCAGRTLVRIDA